MRLGLNCWHNRQKRKWIILQGRDSKDNKTIMKIGTPWEAKAAAQQLKTHNTHMCWYNSTLLQQYSSAAETVLFTCTALLLEKQELCSYLPQSQNMLGVLWAERTLAWQLTVQSELLLAQMWTKLQPALQLEHSVCAIYRHSRLL